MSGGSETVFGREAGIMEGRTEAQWCVHLCRIKIMMIMISLMKEGHSDNISAETDDNDSVLSTIISF